MQFLVANDNGNAEQDLVINGQRISAPNVFARVGKLVNLDELNPEYVLKHIHDNLIVSVEGAIYYVGAYALSSGQRCRSITVGVDNDKVSSDIVYVNTLAHIAGEAVAACYRESGAVPDTGDAIKVHVDMATAIPVSYYTKAKAAAFAEKFMHKQHKVTVYVGAKEYVVFIQFDFVKAIPEGVTAAHAFMHRPTLIHQPENLSAGKFKTLRVLHIAIGEGTTEFPITTGISFKPDFIMGTHNGNGHAIERVLDPFKRDFGLQSVTRQDFSRYLRDATHKYHDAAMSYFMPALEDEAEEILTMAEQVISRANNEVDVVAVYGGGSILMREALEKRLMAFCTRAKIELAYIDDPSDAVFLEAEGLNAFINSPLFQPLGDKTRSGRERITEMAEKNVITKSVCFPRTAEFEEFVAKQKNFSRTICILVQQSIFQHGGKIVDVLEEYESVSRDIVFRRQISELSKTMEENEGGPFLVDENPTIPAEEEHRREEPTASQGDDSIPEGYQ